MAADMPARYRLPDPTRAAPAPRAQVSPPRVFGASRGVSFVSADGEAYEPPVVFLPSDPPAMVQQVRYCTTWHAGDAVPRGGTGTMPGSSDTLRRAGTHTGIAGP